MNDKITITRLSRSSWFKLVFGDLVIHFDPGYAGFFENQHTPLEELKTPADYVLISHPHKDHLREEIVKQIVTNRTKIICPSTCAESLNIPLDLVKPGDILDYSGIHVEVVHAYNTPEGNSERKYHRRGDFVGFIIELAGKRIYFAGDTDFIPEMRGFRDVEVAFLPIGGTYVMDHGEALEAALVIKPTFLIPMHQADTDTKEFKRMVESESDIRVITFDVGDRAEI